LLNYGWTYPSAAAFVQHLRATSEVLRRQGLRLIFKPHPAHASETLASVAACGIEVCSRDEFIPALVRCRAAIVEVSSAAVVPMLLGMPVFLGAYGPLGGQRYGPLLTSYPRAFRVDDIAATSSLLSTHDLSASEKAVHFWINSNAGPMPPGDMPARVAEVVASLARDAAHSGS
jgi:hypothetical protein